MNTKVFRKFAKHITNELWLTDEDGESSKMIQAEAIKAFSPAYDLLEEAHRLLDIAAPTAQRELKARITALLSQKGNNLESREGLDLEQEPQVAGSNPADSTISPSKEEKCGTCYGAGMTGGYYMSTGEPCDNIEPCKACKGTGTIPAAQKNGDGA